jgi:hypothetical protein
MHNNVGIYSWLMVGLLSSGLLGASCMVHAGNPYSMPEVPNLDTVAAEHARRAAEQAAQQRGKKLEEAEQKWNELEAAEHEKNLQAFRESIAKMKQAKKEFDRMFPPTKKDE